MCANLQTKQTTLTFLAQICPKMNLGLEIQKTNVGIRIIILGTLWVPIFRQNNNFDFFCPNLPKNKFWGQNFKNLSADSESAPPRYHVCQFSAKTDNFEFFHQNLGKLPNYMWYFGSNNVEGVAKNSVEAEMSWVEVGPRFSNTLKFINYTSRATLWQKTVL